MGRGSRCLQCTKRADRPAGTPASSAPRSIVRRLRRQRFRSPAVCSTRRLNDDALTDVSATCSVSSFPLRSHFMTDAHKLRVGFTGLGRRGQAMAKRILEAGHALVVFNRTADKATELVKGGAVLAPSVKAACERREVVISMVSDDAALREVALGA